jgi:hypothetical protein
VLKLPAVVMLPVILRGLAQDGGGNMQPPVPVLSTVTYPPGATDTQARIVIDGVRGAIFEYANGGPVGALVSSWASTAGTDPYGNPYPAGFNAGSGSSFSGTNYVINSSGIFFYTGTPALNNLYLSISNLSGAVDGHGNDILQGTVNYFYNGVGTYYAVEMTGAGFTWWSASTMAGPWSNIGNLVATDGFQIDTAAGFTGNIDISQSDVSVLTNSNLTGPNVISAIYTIPAGDLNVATEYYIDLPFTAMMESQTLELGLSIDGAVAYTCNVVISGAIVAAGIGITGVIRVHLKCVTTGSAGTVNCWTEGWVNQTSASVTFTNSGSLAGNEANGVALNTQTAHTMRVNSTWGAAAAGQTIKTVGSSLHRVGI